MLREELVDAHEFCTQNNVGVTFINALGEYGLIKIINLENNPFLESSELQQVERMVRLHYELHVNLEGIDVIRGLLDRIEHLQQQIVVLNNRLHFFEHNT